MKHKSDVLEKLKTFINLVETHYQRRVKILHVDNGREYCNEVITRYLCAKGISLETTAPYTPEQNGRAERDNRYRRMRKDYVTRQKLTGKSVG